MEVLDLFCGAGGAARGYQLAGFQVTGVDHQPQPRYCGERFVQAEALAYLAAHGREYALIHASPPCQPYSCLKAFARPQPRLVPALRDALWRCGRPFVMENVPGAPLHFPLLLCGTMFGLATPNGAQLRRHRLFECSHLVLAPGECQHGPRTVTIAGHHFREKKRFLRTRQGTVSLADAQHAMGIDWMTKSELAQALPPIYTWWIGQHFRTYLSRFSSERTAP
jgi:DNA (cytosine-5)-methyltransferase 1